MDTDTFIVYIRTDNICKEIAEDVETRFDNCYQKTKNKKVIGLMKDELSRKIMTRTYNYLIDKKAKGSKKCVIKRKLKFENYKNCLEATQLDNKIKHLKKT